MSASPLGPTAAPPSGPAVAPEFSRPLKVSGLPENGLTFRETANADERAALATRYGVRGVKRFTVDGKLRRDGPGWRLTGRVAARVTQTCVATLDPVDQIIDEPFDRLFVPGAAALDDLIDLDIEADDPPEPLGRTIDPGEAAAEAAALALDPYPRAGGAGIVDTAVAEEGIAPLTDEDARPRPFAGLEALKQRMERDGDGS
jgi:uncharacterized metal-binding protein YceD (DUF177 family)